MRRVIEYVWGDDPDELQAIVNEKLSSGWELYGPLVVAADPETAALLYQPMVRREQPEAWEWEGHIAHGESKEIATRRGANIVQVPEGWVLCAVCAEAHGSTRRHDVRQSYCEACGRDLE